MAYIVPITNGGTGVDNEVSLAQNVINTTGIFAPISTAWIDSTLDPYDSLQTASSVVLATEGSILNVTILPTDPAGRSVDLTDPDHWALNGNFLFTEDDDGARKKIEWNYIKVYSQDQTRPITGPLTFKINITNQTRDQITAFMADNPVECRYVLSARNA